MACVWRLHRNWRTNRHCNHYNPKIFYLYFVYYNGFAFDYLSIYCFLDEHQKIHPQFKKKPCSGLASIKLPPFLASLISRVKLLINPSATYWPHRFLQWKGWDAFQ